jgi:hypothetical protein
MCEEHLWSEFTLTVADDKLIIIRSKGNLYIVEASSSSYKEISSCKLPTEFGFVL